MKITAQSLLERGYRRCVTSEGVYFAKGKFAVVNDGGTWVPCNLESHRPYAIGTYVNTLQELERLEQEALM